MIADQQELYGVLRQYNPWWETGRVPDIPEWRRVAFRELRTWVTTPPAPRAILLSGARQTGKTTLILQVIDSMLQEGIAPGRILYATFDHPLLKLIGLEGLLKVWRELEPRHEGEEYLFLDEIQFTLGWQTWVKHQVDFAKSLRIAVTGSAVPLQTEALESGVGRWHTIKLPTLSFFEYLKIKDVVAPSLPEVSSLTEIFAMSETELGRIGIMAAPLVAHFHEYLLRGGFPQTAKVESIAIAQKLLREDIVDRVLKRDMTALFGVRRVLELEKTFLYLCLHDGGILEYSKLCASLDLKKPTVSKFIDLFEASHLIYKLPPFGYGREILRARFKVYLADAAMAGSVLLRGRSLLEDAVKLGAAVEAAFFKHLFTTYYQTSNIGFSYWRSKRSGHEVDIVAEIEGQIVPFEVKYRSGKMKSDDLKGLQLLCGERRIDRAYLITRDMTELGVVQLPVSSAKGKYSETKTSLLKLPAPLACYWLSRSETR